MILFPKFPKSIKSGDREPVRSNEESPELILFKRFIPLNICKEFIVILEIIGCRSVELRF